jgi:uncharacterized tellurite resistance protein B-like protein
MKYTLLEKLAIVKVLDEMILADKIEDPKEREYLNNVATELQITPEFTIESRQLRNAECLDILRRMEPEKKDKFTQMLREITEADGHADPAEVNMMIGIFESLGLNEQDERPVYSRELWNIVDVIVGIGLIRYSGPNPATNSGDTRPLIPAYPANF